MVSYTTVHSCFLMSSQGTQFSSSHVASEAEINFSAFAFFQASERSKPDDLMGR